MILYADIYFAVNCIIDFMLLCITAHVAKHPKRLLRIVAASVVAAILSLFSTVMEQNFISLIFAFTIPALMILISFGKTTVLRFFECYMILFGCTFLAGGAFRVLSENDILPNGFFGFLILCFVFLFCFLYFDVFSLKKDTDYVDITIRGEKYEKELHLLCDSGCIAKEPISGLPVILISPKIYDGIYKNKDNVEHKFRIIPINTASGKCVVEGHIPDNITYQKNKKTIKCSAVIARSNDVCFVGTDGIFPTSLLKM